MITSAMFRRIVITLVGIKSNFSSDQYAILGHKKSFKTRMCVRKHASINGV